MRLARKLMLLAMMAMAAMALAAPSAFAQEEDVEATQESTGNHCSAVVVVDHEPTGGCPIHATSEGSVVLRQHVFGIESTVTTCNNEFEGRVDENGEGYIGHQLLTGASCTREPCEEPDGHAKPWPAHGHENPTGPHPDYPFGIVVTFCVSTIPDMEDLPLCNIEVPFRTESGEPGAASGALHHYEFGEPGGFEMPGIGTAGFRCELVGHWMTEEPGTDAVIDHIN